MVYLFHIAILAAIFILLTVSLNMVLGFAGIVTLGHIALYGVGACVSAILSLTYDVPVVVAMLCGGLVSAFVGGIFALFTRKLDGDYMALTTVGLMFIIYAVFQNWISVTRGPMGIPGIPRPDIFGFILYDRVWYFVFVVIIVSLCVMLITRLMRSRYGRVLEALRDDLIGAQALGKPVYRLRVEVFMFASFFAGMAGGLFAHYIQFIDPSSFYLHDIIIILSMVIVGGLASIRGSIIAAIILVALPEMLRFVDIPSNVLGPVRQMLYAGILILILLYRPRGLFGKVDLE